MAYRPPGSQDSKDGLSGSAGGAGDTKPPPMPEESGKSKVASWLTSQSSTMQAMVKLEGLKTEKKDVMTLSDSDDVQTISSGSEDNKEQGRQAQGPVKRQVTVKSTRGFALKSTHGLVENLKGALEFLSMDNGAMDNFMKQQVSEIQKTKDKANRLETEIGAQFEKMHAFLRKREAEVKRELLNEERKCLESMDKNLVVIRDRLMGRRETEVVLLSVLAIAEPDYYLQFSLHRHESEEDTSCADIRVNDLQVTPDSLCLGPYETHLQFFMWKDMLQVIRSVPEPLAMKNDRKGNLIVSAEGSSVWPVDKETGFQLWSNASSEATTVSREWFHYGQHYWEVHVRGKLDF
ncbi:hypothetical protein AAFF_G00219640 [Aldrovandia affinis]|uniref:B30.2/SPRY domain-containing protein n=1 Tax=Aldrovandia affinis TaxID=143900 RepID=A0AAD7QZW6_9TELE|nr:hypothetical protein AAFF_G00219640 [Aldrovandia affinis]